MPVSAKELLDLFLMRTRIKRELKKKKIPTKPTKKFLFKGFKLVTVGAWSSFYFSSVSKGMEQNQVEFLGFQGRKGIVPFLKILPKKKKRIFFPVFVPLSERSRALVWIPPGFSRDAGNGVQC